uniref:Uncharacterized protein n=1 Tax=Hyaloperonospora arabidopsidis (strain Emoy2) TaxID=559515 RepID=M4C1B0_HYAAE
MDCAARASSEGAAEKRTLGISTGRSSWTDQCVRQLETRRSMGDGGWCCERWLGEWTGPCRACGH